MTQDEMQALLYIERIKQGDTVETALYFARNGAAAYFFGRQPAITLQLQLDEVTHENEKLKTENSRLRCELDNSLNPVI